MKSNIKPQTSNIPEWELLPPEQKKKRAAVDPLFKWLALIMDNVLRVPGTNLRFGLDPIIGLFPGVGDTASAVVSAIALIQAARAGVPKILLSRMAANVLINELVGIIPGIGDAFSFWFKSNARNYELLKQYSAAPHLRRRSDWIFVIVVLGVLAAIVVAGIIVSLLVLLALERLLFGSHSAGTGFV